VLRGPAVLIRRVGGVEPNGIRRGLCGSSLWSHEFGLAEPAQAADACLPCCEWRGCRVLKGPVETFNVLNGPFRTWPIGAKAPFAPRPAERMAGFSCREGALRDGERPEGHPGDVTNLPFAGTGRDRPGAARPARVAGRPKRYCPEGHREAGRPGTLAKPHEKDTTEQTTPRPQTSTPTNSPGQTAPDSPSRTRLTAPRYLHRELLIRDARRVRVRSGPRSSARAGTRSVRRSSNCGRERFRRRCRRRGGRGPRCRSTGDHRCRLPCRTEWS
jgi:hypothetical protein